jgi:RNA polymerase sigma factor (sigma-70 family)
MSKNNQVEFTIWLREREAALLRAARGIAFDAQNAEDILQEALADVYQRWNKLKDHENPEAYVIRVMVSKHADMRRKWWRRQQENETPWEFAEGVRNIADQSDDVIQRLLVQSALKTLTAAQRAVLVLHYEHGLVLREVADILELPMGTVASHLARGKAAVAAHLELVPEFEKSIKKELPPLLKSGAEGRLETNIAEVVLGEVVDE